MSENNNFNQENENVNSSESVNQETNTASSSETSQQSTVIEPEIKVTQSSTAPHKSTKDKKSHSGLKSVGLVALCFCAGLGGGAISQSYMNSKNTVVIQQNVSTSSDSADSEVTTVSTDTSSIDAVSVAAAATPSVVSIVTENITYSSFISSYVTEGAGSGVIISSDGYIVTNNHVIEDASKITVTTSDGTEYEATLVGADSETDVAVIKIDATGLTAATLGDSDSIVVGEGVVAIGNPLGTLASSVTSGIISATERTITVDDMTLEVMQTDTAISPGNSGGGLFNAQGELIGIVNAKSSSENAEGIGFALPINNVLEVATQLIEQGYVSGRPAIGVSVQTASYMDGSTALVIAGFADQSDADEAGLQVGDIIIAANNTTVSSYSDLRSIINEFEVGDTISITVQRDDQIITADITLIEKDSATYSSTTTSSTQDSDSSGSYYYNFGN